MLPERRGLQFDRDRRAAKTDLLFRSPRAAMPPSSPALSVRRQEVPAQAQLSAVSANADTAARTRCVSHWPAPPVLALSSWPSSKSVRGLSFGLSRSNSQRAVNEHFLGVGVDAERIAVPQHNVGFLARLERADFVEDAERLGWIARHPRDRVRARNVVTHSSARQHGFGDFLVEALDAGIGSSEWIVTQAPACIDHAR